MTKLPLGVIVILEGDMVSKLQKVKDMGIPTCQVTAIAEDLNDEKRDNLLKAVKQTGITITSFFFLCNGYIWDLLYGPNTIGFVPMATRKERFVLARKSSDFVESINVKIITTHLGFIPENPKDTLYTTLIPELRKFALYCKNKGQTFCFETGQETPVTLRRTIEDVGTGNIGINLDPANLLLYGKGNPVDALDLLGHFVKGVHCKDGDYPTIPNKLGAEYPIGEGKVNFPVFIPKLKSMGYTGPLTIEREISGEQQIKDILRAKKNLDKLR